MWKKDFWSVPDGNRRNKEIRGNEVKVPCHRIRAGDSKSSRLSAGGGSAALIRGRDGCHELGSTATTSTVWYSVISVIKKNAARIVGEQGEEDERVSIALQSKIFNFWFNLRYSFLVQLTFELWFILKVHIYLISETNLTDPETCKQGVSNFLSICSSTSLQKAWPATKVLGGSTRQKSGFSKVKPLSPWQNWIVYRDFYIQKCSPHAISCDRTG